MNRQPENITPLAEKLQQITLPHVDENWVAMKTLLDKEMPVAQNKHRKRWLLLIMLLLLFIGLCNDPVVLRWSGLTGKDNATVNYNPPSDKKNATPKTNLSLNSETHSVKIKGDKKTVSEDSVLMISHRKQKIDKNEPLNYSSNKKNQTHKIHQVPARGIKIIQTSDSTHNIADVEERNEKRNVKMKKENEKNSNNLSTGKNENKQQDLMTYDNLSLRKNKTDTVSEDSIGKKDGASNSDSKKDKQIVEINAQHPVAKKIAKSDSTEDAKGFLFAVGINQFFPVGHQEKINFNPNGRSSGIGSYIPVPVARYYFHKWLYVQAEAQFNAPQYTKELLASSSVSFSSIQDTTKSVFIKKLFYFNLPLSVHYSPFKNLYFGAGVQYSMLTNGVALSENLKGSTVSSTTRPFYDSLLISSKVVNLKKTAAYSKLRTNEVRFLFDVNYQWKPFTIGVRYNQAFTNFINVHISNTIVTQAHNASLQLYLRYTILDFRKKILVPK